MPSAIERLKRRAEETSLGVPADPEESGAGRSTCHSATGMLPKGTTQGGSDGRLDDIWLPLDTVGILWELVLPIAVASRFGTPVKNSSLK